MKANVAAKVVSQVVEGTTPGGAAFKKFAIAIKKGSVNVEGKTSIFGVKVFGKNAEISIKTGDIVEVDGKLTIENFQVSSDKPAAQTALINARTIYVNETKRMKARTYNVLGNLTKDAELKYFGQDNKALAATTVAVNDKVSNQEITSFVNIAIFGKQAESLSQYLTKGKKISICGELKAEYFTKNDNTQGLSVNIAVDNDGFDFAGGKSDNSQHNAVETSHASSIPESPYEVMSEDENPF